MRWWSSVAAAELRKILAFRSDFWVTFVGQTLIQVLIARSLWQAIFESSGSEVMAGFTLPMMTLYYLIVPVGQKMLAGENMGFVSREIYEGTFSRYLVYPISFFQYKLITYLTYSLFYGLQLVLIFGAYTLITGGTFTLTQAGLLALGVFFFLVASLAYANLALCVELICLWADNIWTLMVMVRFFCYFMGGAYVPLNFFPAGLQPALKFLPFSYLISFPVRTMMGLNSGTEMLSGFGVLLLWSLLFHLAARALWWRGQYRYTGVGI